MTRQEVSLCSLPTGCATAAMMTMARGTRGKTRRLAVWKIPTVQEGVWECPSSHIADASDHPRRCRWMKDGRKVICRCSLQNICDSQLTSKDGSKEHGQESLCLMRPPSLAR